MCYNPEVSLATFIFGCIGAIIVHYLNVIDKSIIILLLSFTFIQFIEFLTWTYYDNLKINRILSILAFITITIQIILLQLYLLIPKYRKWSLIILSIVILLFIMFQLPKVDFRMRRGKNKHLAWYWIDLPIIWVIIGLSFYLIPAFFNKYNNKLLFLLIFVSLLISLYFHYKYKTWATMWCYISNFYWIIILIYSFY